MIILVCSWIVNGESMLGKKVKRGAGMISWRRKRRDSGEVSCLFQPSVYHALVVIFLEFFAWGLLTSPIITVLNETFPDQTFLMNGLIQGVKGLLSFLAAPLIGALSDAWGRKPFLFLTVGFTCAPIPLMKFSPWWYFAVLSLSGVFSVTFSIVFAYVADVTTQEDRSAAYGLVSATFAASLVTSPAIGAYLENYYSDTLVIALATAVAVLDIFFILVFVPESLPEKVRPANWSSNLSWEKADPFGALRKIGHDQLILMLCVTVFLSYLPEAGEYSCFFVYLSLVMHFSREQVASFIAVIGVLSVFAQTAMLAFLMKYLGPKHSIMLGLLFELIQLAIYGFGSQPFLMWVAGSVAAMGSITYPAISAFVSNHADVESQGVAQGIVTGIRGLCNGLGPALFGFIFYLFHVDLSEPGHGGDSVPPNQSDPEPTRTLLHQIHEKIMPGPPFAFGTVLVIMALLVAIFIPEEPKNSAKSPTRRTAPTELEVFHRDTDYQHSRRVASFWSKSGSMKTEHGFDGFRIQEKEPLMSAMEEVT